MSKLSKKTQATHTNAASAAELAVLVENGAEAEAQARIRTLNQADFIRVTRVIQQLDTALSAYALSWKNSEYWGRGCDFPA
jgi:hypothetical protein